MGQKYVLSSSFSRRNQTSTGLDAGRERPPIYTCKSLTRRNHWRASFARPLVNVNLSQTVVFPGARVAEPASAPAKFRRILCVFPRYTPSFGTFEYSYGLTMGT